MIPHVQVGGRCLDLGDQRRDVLDERRRHRERERNADRCRAGVECDASTVSLRSADGVDGIDDHQRRFVKRPVEDVTRRASAAEVESVVVGVDERLDERKRYILHTTSTDGPDLSDVTTEVE